MGRKNGSTQYTGREQRSKRERYVHHDLDLDLMVRFSVSRDRDRAGTGR